MKNSVNKDIEVNILNVEQVDNYNDILDIPEGCRACGGPYPSCMSSCPMFDD